MRLLLLLPLCVGCQGMASFERQLAKDPATVVFTTVHPYGNVHLIRVGNTTNTLIITGDGAVTVNPK